MGQLSSRCRPPYATSEKPPISSSRPRTSTRIVTTYVSKARRDSPLASLRWESDPSPTFPELLPPLPIPSPRLLAVNRSRRRLAGGQAVRPRRVPLASRQPWVNGRIPLASLLRLQAHLPSDRLRSRRILSVNHRNRNRSNSSLRHLASLPRSDQDSLNPPSVSHPSRRRPLVKHHNRLQHSVKRHSPRRHLASLPNLGRSPVLSGRLRSVSHRSRVPDNLPSVSPASWARSQIPLAQHHQIQPLAPLPVRRTIATTITMLHPALSGNHQINQTRTTQVRLALRQITQANRAAHLGNPHKLRARSARPLPPPTRLPREARTRMLRKVLATHSVRRQSRNLVHLAQVSSPNKHLEMRLASSPLLVIRLLPTTQRAVLLTHSANHPATMLKQHRNHKLTVLLDPVHTRLVVTGSTLRSRVTAQRGWMDD